MRQQSFEVLFRHGLDRYFLIQLPPLQLHVHCTLAAHRTLVRHRHQVLIAIAMHVMPAWQADNGNFGLEHQIQTERAIAFRGPLNTRMRSRCGDGYAHIATLAVHKVLAQSFAHTANATVIAMIDPLIRIVVPEFAFGTKVPRGIVTAIHTLMRCRLWRLTEHTEHVLRLVSI